MHRVEAKLAQWKNLHLALGQADQQLAKAMARRDHEFIPVLRADVERLQKEGSAALAAVYAQIAAAQTDHPVASLW
jgi:hypothetical protein